jgi:hypothetical protein
MRNKLIFIFICLVIALAFFFLLTGKAQAGPAPLQPMISCAIMPTPAFDGIPANLDWNSDTGRVFNCYDEKTHSVKGLMWGSNLPVNPDDVRIIWARWTLSYNGQVLDSYSYTVESKPNKDGVQHIYYEFKVPDCLDRSKFRLVTDYYERDLAGHGMNRDWSGEFYAQSFCIHFPTILFMPPGPPKNPDCCETCKIKWIWHDVDHNTTKLLDTVQFVDLAKRAPIIAPLYTLWYPDELEGIIVCDKNIIITDIKITIFKETSGVYSFFKDISQDGQDRQFKVNCGKLAYLTDKMLIMVEYKNKGCTCSTGKPVKDPFMLIEEGLLGS